MKEAQFIKINRSKWVEIEDALDGNEKTPPDILTDYFIRITDDLSFAKTYFNQSNTHTYLNEIASRLHRLIYQNKKESSRRFITFWKEEVPAAVFSARKELVYSLIIFSISIAIGAFSSAYDLEFARLIMGDGYINMTDANIEKGDPMAVYKDARQLNMFFGITINNIKVSFVVFAFGLFFSIGSGFMLFQNGVMLGAFQYYFFQKGLLLPSALTIWIHGTVEISSIIIAGGAGMVLGNSILFPGTYSRLDSLKHGAKKGLKIIMGLVPFFIFAGILESYVTRLTEMPDLIKVAIILLSLLIIILYFIIYPIQIAHHGRKVHPENSAV